MCGKRESVFDLDIIVRDPKRVTGGMRDKWSALVARTAGSGEAPSIIFLGELLEILDPGSACSFTCESYEAEDMFGSCDIRWTLSTERLSFSRARVSRADESWPGSNAVVDEAKASGFPPGTGMFWNGKTGDRGMSLRLLGVGEDSEMKIGEIARALFNEVSVTRTMLA